MDAPREHKAHAPTRVAFGLLTVSDSRDLARDASGDEIARILKDAGHAVARRELVRDEAAQIRGAVEAMLAAGEVEAVVTTGGTGVAPRDVTIEAIEPLFAKRLPGFGEVFRALSYQEVGSAAIMSRAEAGVARGKPVFVLPGSPKACRLAVERLVVPEVGHVVSLLRR